MKHIFTWTMMLITGILLAVGMQACSREEGVFQIAGRGYEVKEVRPGLTCVFTNGEDAGVACVAGSFPARE